LLNYLNFILFAPTFLAGPPLGYKNFLSFRSMPSSKRPEIFKFILLLISFELYQHFFPVMNFSHETSLIKVELITLFHLVFIWYKFLIIWRFHRAWAQLYGIDVIDNMSRCIMNNYCFEGFWRMWHRGFNQWLIRYLYIPLGGNKSLFSVVVAVVFVAFWHDHTLNIVVWALGIILCILPEILIKRYVNKHYSHLFREHWFKYLCAFVASIYIFCLVLINIAGFGYGAEKIGLVWDKMKQEWAELILSLYVITGVVILMFYIRTREGHKINY
jgi:protein-cysteine N-palmitoyltransferase HHAT